MLLILDLFQMEVSVNVSEIDIINTHIFSWLIKGTWMMTGNGVMHNGITIVEQYGLSLDRLQAGDRVGVMRRDDGTLHFWVCSDYSLFSAYGQTFKLFFYQLGKWC